MRVLWIPVLALYAAVGCGEAEPTGPSPLPDNTEVGIIVIEDAPEEAGSLPGCERLPRLPPDPDVVVALGEQDLAVVYDEGAAVCSAPAVTLHQIGLISDREWFRLNVLLGSGGDSPLGSSDPIPARETEDPVGSSDPIPAMPKDKMKADAAPAGPMR